MFAEAFTLVLFFIILFLVAGWDERRLNAQTTKRMFMGNRVGRNDQ
jgi:hypothetical protein